MQPTLKKQLCGLFFFFFLAHNSRQKSRRGSRGSECELNIPRYALCNQIVLYTCNKVLYNSTAVNPTLFIIQGFFVFVFFFVSQSFCRLVVCVVLITVPIARRSPEVVFSSFNVMRHILHHTVYVRRPTWTLRGLISVSLG